MIRYVFIFTLLLVSPLAIAQPCEITTLASPQTITCGDCTTLSAFGYGAGNIAFEEDFNSGSPVGWQFTQAVTIANNTCGVPSPDGSNFMWMGDASVNPRSMETVPFDLTLGGVICFDMRYSEQGDASPCEGPDLSNEGVYVQYSTNNGATWTTIEYWNPNGGYDPQLTQWNQYCVTIPAGAQTGNTMIRWYQDDVSGAVYDHWGIDNVLITLNDPNFGISWTHDGYSYGLGQGGGVNPNDVSPTVTTTYEAVITDGVETCVSTVTVIVVDPVMVVDAGEPASICPGDCVELDAEAMVIVSPASQPTFSNGEVSTLIGIPDFSDLLELLLPISIPCLSISGCNCPDGTSVSFGQSCPQITSSTFEATISMPINVANMNSTLIEDGILTEVCIGDAVMTTQNFTPFEITLVCPSGQSIILANVGDVQGSTLLGACFDLTSVTPIASGSSPYTGNWQPVESFSNLSGCDTQGEWTVVFTGEFTFDSNVQLSDIPTGFLNGWNISFDDPEISYEADFTWSPTTNMTGETTLNPTVCPNVETTYTLEATDANGCITVTDVVTISIDNDCCALTIDDVATTPAGCGASDGSATVTVSGDISGLQFSIDGGTTFQSSSTFSNLAAGNYTVQATDDNACDVFFNFTIDQDNAPEITDVTSTNPSCGATDGTITITASNGTLPYEYSIDGTNFDVNNSFNSLAAGTYTIIVSDANGCEDTQDISLINTDGPSVQSTNIVDANCGQDNGEITINLTGGTLPYSFSLDGAPSSTTNNFSNLAAGTYTITFEDASGCEGSESVTILDSDGITIENIAVTDASCGVNDGEISITVSGGTAPFTFDLNNGVIIQNDGDFTNLAAGNYAILITDVNGCEANETASINNTDGPQIDQLTVVDPDCIEENGTITIIASSGTAPLSYSIDNGVTSQNDGLFENLAAGTYSVAVVDDNGCTVNQNVTLTAPLAPIINTIATVNIDCTTPTGTATIVGSGGTAPYGFGITDGITTETSLTGSFTGLSAGNYTATIVDQNGCSATDVFVITNSSDVQLTLVTSSLSCNGDCDATATVTAAGGTVSGDYTYNWSTGGTANSIAGLCAGTYSVTVTDDDGCIADTTFTIANPPAISISVDVVAESCSGACDGAMSINAPAGSLISIDGGNDFSSISTYNSICPNNYSIVVIDQNDCIATTNAIVPSGEIVQSNFIVNPGITTVIDANFNTVNYSQNGENYYWEFDGMPVSTDFEPYIQLGDSLEAGNYPLCLITESEAGCRDTNCQIITVQSDILIYVPNTFTPDGNKFNEVFFPIITTDTELLDFEFLIYNRWGELVFESRNPNAGWDGTYGGMISPDGTYTWKMRLVWNNENKDQDKIITGHINLLR